VKLRRLARSRPEIIPVSLMGHPPPPAPPHVESFGVGIRVLLGAAAVGALLLVLGMAMG